MDTNTTASVAPSQAGRVRAIRTRNMGLLTRTVNKETLPTRTTNHSSPAKRTAQNRLPGQPQVRAVVDEAIKHELAEARFVTPDLADHMFGHLVSIELAKDILERFVTDGVVEIRRSGRRLPPTSLEAKHALDAAFKDAKAHGCSPSTAEAQEQKASTSSTARRRSKRQPKKQVTTKQATTSTSTSTSTPTYSFRWVGYPSSPINEDQLVEFLNKITDLAWDAAKPKLDQSQFKLRNRFAAPTDKKHAVPLAYEIDGEDMRPDFLLLPIEAFSTDHKTFDEKYINFTVPRAAGESKTTDFGSGLTQVHRYARGIRRAQPWVHFVVALTLTKERMALLRGEGSGTERLELALSGGQGCMEFIQIVLGLALAGDEDLGQNSDVVVDSSEVSCRLTKPTPFPEVQKPAATSYRQTDPTTTTTASSSAPPEIESGAIPEGGYNTRSRSRTTQSSNATNPSVPPSYTGSSASRGSYSSAQLDDDAEEVEDEGEEEQEQEDEEEDEEEEEQEEEPIAKPTTTSSSSKRGHAEVDADYQDKEEPSRKKRAVYVDRVAFIPIVVYGYKCLGVVFTSSSIRGRGTTVFCVVDLEDESKLLALNMSWQDIAREAEQTEVLDRLRAQQPHPNIVVPFRTFKASRKDKLCTTLGGIRDILDEHLAAFPEENRVLTIHVAQLKRPTKYFWGVHDFVRGLRCAILGHAFLTKIGILHRDISENNIVLARRPWEERGYLIDFDMATLQDPDEKISVPAARTRKEKYNAAVKSSSPIPADETRPLKALRTGTTPYMSFNVLNGNKHTYYDDMESFLYVLLFFFLSYAGPLSKQELWAADSRGFTHKLGSGRLSHMQSLPERFNKWADGDLSTIADLKHASLAANQGADKLIRSPEVKKCLEDNWPEELRDPIRYLLWNCWSLFADSRVQDGPDLNCTKVSHDQFVQVLDEWFKENGELEERFSNCPEF